MSSGMPQGPGGPGGGAGARGREFELQRGLGQPGEAAGVGGKARLRSEEFRAQRALERGRAISAEASAESLYLRGSRQKAELVAAAPPATTGVAWKPVGPAGIPNGQTYGAGTTTVAGRVGAVAVDPGDSAHLLIGSAAGGVWGTRDAGATWTPLTDDQPTLSIGALAFDPSEPATVYAGTGEGNWAYSELGQGILRSGDGGESWIPLDRERFAQQGFYRLLVDPHDGTHLLAATTAEAAVSTDSGATWSVLHSGPTWDVSLAYQGDEPEVLLAAPDGLFRSDGSSTPVKVELPGLPGAIERMAVTHCPSHPGQAFAFAGTQKKAFLWHRGGAGEPFVAVALPPLAVGPNVKEAFSVKQAFYDWYVAVPPHTPDVVYLGMIELVKGERSASGWHWSDISSRLEGDSIHPDQHTMAFDPSDPDVLYAGNDGGVFRSPDQGDSWKSLNDGLEISEVEYLTQRPDEPSWILAGLQDNGTVRRGGDGKWTQVGLGDGGDCATDMADPDTCYRSYTYMVTFRSEAGGDAGSWDEITPKLSIPVAAFFYPPLEVNGKLVAKAGTVVCLSRNGGKKWEGVPLPQLDPKGTAATALAVPSSNEVIAGTNLGHVYRIAWQGEEWTPAAELAQPVAGWISDLLVDPDRPQRIWATFSHPGSVFRSDDAGASWANVTANLPTLPVNAIVTDPADRDRVWVACDVGVFESRDAGGTWAAYGTGLPNALAEDLLFHESDRLLRVATRSRGVWEASA